MQNIVSLHCILDLLIFPVNQLLTYLEQKVTQEPRAVFSDRGYYVCNNKYSNHPVASLVSPGGVLELVKGKRKLPTLF